MSGVSDHDEGHDLPKVKASLEYKEDGEPKRSKVEPTSLQFVDMPGRESTWRADNNGYAIIPSPIANLPKPLALAYRNYNEHYDKYNIQVTELGDKFPLRTFVANRLVTSLLRHYFAPPSYTVMRLSGQLQDLVKDVPTVGTQYFIVLKKSDSVQELQHDMVMDTGDESRPLASSIHLILAVVTEPQFTRSLARMQPTQLQISRKYLGSNGSLSIQGMGTPRCGVVLLTGTWKPPKPSFEFYSFESRRSHSQVLMPWFGQLQKRLPCSTTNIIPLSADKVNDVDSMFNAIVACSLDNRLVDPSEEYCNKTQTYDHLSNSPKEHKVKIETFRKVSKKRSETPAQ